MRLLIRFTYISGNEPCFVDPDQVVAIRPANKAEASRGCAILLEWGHEVRVAENAEQAYAMLKTGNTPAKQDRRKARPKLSRGRDAEQS
jgi:hypothetical protein